MANTEKEFMKVILLIITKGKKSRNKFTKEGRDCYSENYKELIKEIQETQRCEKTSPDQGLETLALLKLPVLPKGSIDTMKFS